MPASGYFESMRNTDPETVLEQLRWRYAVKQFDSSKRIPADLWRTLEAVLVATPSSYGLQPWSFVVIETPSTRRALREAAFGQAQVEDASHLVAMCAREPFGMDDVDAHVARMAEVRSVDPSMFAKFRELVMSRLFDGVFDVAGWADEQVYIALGQFMATAAYLGVDTCALGGIDHARVDAILGLREKGLRTVIVCAAGYRSDADKYATLPKVRFPSERVILRA